MVCTQYIYSKDQLQTFSEEVKFSVCFVSFALKINVKNQSYDILIFASGTLLVLFFGFFSILFY